MSRGEDNEASVMRVLYDITYSGSSTGDALSLGYSTVWNLVKNNNCTTLSNFLSTVDNGTIGRQLLLGDILTYHKIASEITGPVDNYGSTTGIPTFTWDPNVTIHSPFNFHS